MLNSTKEIKVKIATDKPFRSIYWTPTQEELRQIVAGALKSFEEQFPTISFRLQSKEEVWDSQGYPTMLDFPFSLIMDIPNVSSFSEVMKVLAQRAEDAGFRKETIIRNEDGLSKIIRRNKNKPKEHQFFYLWGYFNGLFSREMLLDLKQKVPLQAESEIVLGFTARFFVMNNPFGGCAGSAQLKGNYAVFPMQIKLKSSFVILHELGHLFGAEHIKKDKALSVMNETYLGEKYLFDPKNVKKINDYIESL